eukprot:12046782-Alexandrium_andersonii.AAC.1
MSASLVGSEMCIRDRPQGAPRRSLPARCPLPRGRRRADPQLGGCGVGPVSYTHLTLPTICSV